MIEPIPKNQAASVAFHLPPVVVASYDAAIGRMIALALRLEGYRPQQYADGERALQVLLSEPCAAAVLDAHLAKVDGLTICHKVRASAVGSSLPIMLLLMREDEALWQAQAHQVRVSAAFYIPFQISDLIAAVTTGINGGRSSLDSAR